MTEKSAALDPSDIVDCWSDDERMNFLFSAFPPARSVNSHHWDTKMSFWKNLITEMSAQSSHSYVSWNNLFARLSRNGKHPLGLHTVFSELLDSGELIPATQYVQDIRADETWVGWGLKWCVKKPVGWMTDKVLSPMKSSPLKDMKKGQFVLIPSLERKCSAVVSLFRDYISDNKSSDYEFLSIISYSKLQNIVKDTLCDSMSLDLALVTLRKNRTVQVWSPDSSHGSTAAKIDSSVEKFIKFAKDGEEKACQFTEADIGIIKLCETKSHLNELISKGYRETEECMQKARKCLKDDQKTMAKSALRKKKRIEAGLEKKEQSLSNVEQLLESLHQCQTDKMLMETYKVAVAAYKDASDGLTQEAVQSTMDDVADVLDIQADISGALSGSLHHDDSSDLEEELAALMKPKSDDMLDITSKMGEVTINDNNTTNLPDVPHHSLKVARGDARGTPGSSPNLTPLPS